VQAKLVKREGNYGWFKIGSNRMEKVPIKIDVNEDFEYISSDTNPLLRFSALNGLNESERRVTKAKRALYGKKQGVRTIGIISAENPLATQISPEENAKRTVKFRACMRDHLFGESCKAY